MPSVFTRIINGEIPSRFVWRDDRCVGFLSIAPLRPGHTLVVPVDEIDHWIDCPPELITHLTEVAHIIGQALQQAFRPQRVGLIIAGMEVPHAHLHLVPIEREADLHFANADPDPDPAALDAAAEAIRAELRRMSYDPPSG